MKIHSPLSSQSILAAAVGAVLLFGAVAPADAQRDTRRGVRPAKSEEAQKPAAAAVAKYPEATREEPKEKASSQQQRKLQKLGDLYEEDKGAEARALADEILATPKANAYDRSFAAQIGAQVAYDEDDTAAAMDYLQKAIEIGGLDNNGHYGSMLMLAQLQMQEEQYEQSLATFERLFKETRAQKPEHLALKANALYRMERYEEAAETMKQAIAASPEPKPEWTQLLMASYFDAGKIEEASRLAQEIASASPGDKRAQMNLAAAYLQADQYEQAAAVMEALRTSGQLTEAGEYRQLYSTLLNLDGKEREAASVISEGLQKGVLTPSHDTYLALGQAYYFSDQIGPAIEAYQKAAPLAKDGETYLNLARILWEEDRIGEAKAAAREALSKGIKKPEEAKKIVALPDS